MMDFLPRFFSKEFFSQNPELNKLNSWFISCREVPNIEKLHNALFVAWVETCIYYLPSYANWYMNFIQSQCHLQQTKPEDSQRFQACFHHIFTKRDFQYLDKFIESGEVSSYIDLFLEKLLENQVGSKKRLYANALYYKLIAITWDGSRFTIKEYGPDVDIHLYTLTHNNKTYILYPIVSEYGHKTKESIKNSIEAPRSLYRPSESTLSKIIKPKSDREIIQQISQRSRYPLVSSPEDKPPTRIIRSLTDASTISFTKFSIFLAFILLLVAIYLLVQKLIALD